MEPIHRQMDVATTKKTLSKCLYLPRRFLLAFDFCHLSLAVYFESRISESRLQPPMYG